MRIAIIITSVLTLFFLTTQMDFLYPTQTEDIAIVPRESVAQTQQPTSLEEDVDYQTVKADLEAYRP